MPSKLRRLTTAKGLTPAELDIINQNFDYVEFALNSVGAATPGGGPAVIVPGVADHGALSGLFPDDDHAQYLNIQGRTNQEALGNSVDSDGYIGLFGHPFIPLPSVTHGRIAAVLGTNDSKSTFDSMKIGIFERDGALGARKFVVIGDFGWSETSRASTVFGLTQVAFDSIGKIYAGGTSLTDSKNRGINTREGIYFTGSDFFGGYSSIGYIHNKGTGFLAGALSIASYYQNSSGFGGMDYIPIALTNANSGVSWGSLVVGTSVHAASSETVHILTGKDMVLGGHSVYDYKAGTLLTLDFANTIVTESFYLGSSTSVYGLTMGHANIDTLLSLHRGSMTFRAGSTLAITPILQTLAGDLSSSQTALDVVADLTSGARLIDLRTSPSAVPTGRLAHFTADGTWDLNSTRIIGINVTPLIVRASVGHLANLTEWYDTSAVLGVYIDKDAVLNGDGSGLTGVVPAAHTHAETDIIDGAILARVAAAESITGQWDFDAQTDFDAQLRINPARALTTYPHFELRTTASASGVSVFSIYDKANALSVTVDEDGTPQFRGGSATGRSVKFYANDNAWPFFQVGGAGTYIFGFVEDLTAGGVIEFSVSGALGAYSQLVFPAVGGSIMTAFSSDTGIANKTFSGSGNVARTGSSSFWIFEQFTSTTKKAYFAFDSTVFPVSTTRKINFPNRDGQITVTTGYQELSGRTGSVTATTIYATPSATPRLYRVSVYVLTTTTASAADTVQVNVIYTAGGNVHTRAVLLNDSVTTLHALNVANDDDSGHLVIYGDTSTNIQFSTTFTNNGGGDGAYFVAAYVEAI